MRLTPTPLEIGPNDGFTEENDIFGYKPFGEHFADLVCSQDGPLVLVLDSAWGMGKTTFVLQWAGLLRQRGVPVIHFDAFENDFQEDAFIAIAAEITAFANNSLPPTDQTQLEKYKDKGKKLGARLLPASMKIGTRFLLAGFSTEDIKSIGDAIKDVAADSAGDIGVVVESLVADRLQNAYANRLEIGAYRESLQVLAKQLSVHEADKAKNGHRKKSDPRTPQGPLVFIVDELDRCRPTFALNVLERIKHLLSVEGVIFVLVTHMRQLENVVRSTYSLDEEAGVYLDKFIHHKILLPTETKNLQSKRKKYISFLWKSLDLSTDDADYDRFVRDGLAKLSEIYSIPLRTIEKIVTNVALLYAATSRDYMREGCILVVLCIMRQIAPHLYENARGEKLTWDDARTFLRLDEWNERDDSKEAYEMFWRHVTGAEIPDDRWREAIRRDYRRVPDPPEILRVFTEFIDDLIPVEKRPR